MAGKVTGVEDALRKGGSLAYFNFDGICSAAENGKIAIFQMIFEKLDYTRLIPPILLLAGCTPNYSQTKYRDAEKHLTAQTNGRQH